MSRRHALHTFLFASILTLFVAASVNAQSKGYSSNIPTKLAVSSAQRSIGLREQTELRIKLLDQAGNETAASYNVSVKLIATRQRDINTAKQDGRGNISVQRNGTLALPSGVNTVQTVITIQQGRSAASVQFSSHQAGPVRIYAENEKLVTGALLIAIVDRSPRARSSARARDDRAVFMQASFQERQLPPAPPASAAVAAGDAPSYQLELEPEGVSDAELIDNTYVRRFSVALKSGGVYSAILPEQDTEVRLRVMSGAGTLSQTSIIIPRGSYIYPLSETDLPIEVRTTRGGNIAVAAMPVRRGDISVQPAPVVTFQFPTKIRAAKLQVEAIPLVAMANGIESIKLRIRPVDAGNNPVRNEDEGLEVRNITLSLASRTLGLKFENGATTIPIKKGEAFIETSIISSSPVAGARVVAEAENGDQRIITGEQELEFCFPWTQLGGAMLGGLMFPLVLTVFPGKRREQRFARGKLRMMLIYGVVGLILGMLAFTVVFFGALGMTEFNFNGLPITIARLPIHNVLAACAIGFFGGVILATGISIKERAQAATPAPEESPAQA